MAAASSCRRGSSAEPGQPGEVASQVGQADLDPGAEDANGAHDEPEPAFLGGEDVLDARAYPGAGGVAAGEVRRHPLASGFFALELRLQTMALEQGQVGRRMIGGVGPHLARSVVAVEHRAELAAVISRRVGDGVAPQQTVFAVEADMVFVAEHRHRDLDLSLVACARRGHALVAALDGPAPVVVNLRPPRRLPIGRCAAALDRLLLGLGQPRPACRDYRRVDNLPAHR
jgi:hypothetical protein